MKTATECSAYFEMGRGVWGGGESRCGESIMFSRKIYTSARTGGQDTVRLRGFARGIAPEIQGAR